MTATSFKKLFRMGFDDNHYRRYINPRRLRLELIENGLVSQMQSIKLSNGSNATIWWLAKISNIIKYNHQRTNCSVKLGDYTSYLFSMQVGVTIVS